MSAVPVGALRCRLGESPVWEPEAAALWLVDARAPAIHVVNMAGGEIGHISLRQPVTALVRCRSGWLGVISDSLVTIDVTNGDLDPVLRLPGLGATELNDAVCGRDGRLYVGSVDRSGNRGGRLFAVDRHLAVTVMAEGVGASNGLDTSPDGSILYHADTFAGSVTAYPGGQSFAVDRPDGLAVDQSGGIWVALWGSGEVRRYRPGGTLDRVVALPVPLVTNVAFAGQQLGEMVITTAASDNSALSGAVFRFDPGVTGLPSPVFGV